jgi:hypothetical protein
MISRRVFARQTLGAAGALSLFGASRGLQAATTGGLAVEVTGASEPVLCAEKDNVTLNFASREVKKFRIEAAHPSYIGTLQRDSFEADWTACDMTADPTFKSQVTAPTRRTIYEEPDIWLVGWIFPTFWRPPSCVVRVGNAQFHGLHLVQVWTIRPMGGEEVLVFYPQDGYWRSRPKAPEGRAPTAFGSSFLVGPIEQQGRPIVDLKEISFDPKARTFGLSFARGGGAEIKMAEVDQNRHRLEVSLAQPIANGPFASLRSMYITEFNNDVARIAVREAGAKGWREDNIMAFKRASATDVWAGRHATSRHNTSSPDFVFSNFAR